ncbi:MAG: hypothetical protein GF350_14920 [Chitinivibrionales bacterium]|nr:hypothetical protein [Chitinivibrionales bacterium]
MSDNWYVVLLDRAGNEEREIVHSAIKEHANGWWHRHENTWIVGGLTSAKWRDVVKEAMFSGPSSVLVLALPREEAKRYWSYYGPKSKERCKWLHDNIK